MYRFSRSLYRELAPYVSREPICLDGRSNHDVVLAACQEAVHRLATDRHYFANPARTLFREIRVFFPIGEQLRLRRIVDIYMGAAKQYVDSLPAAGVDPLGNRIECRATTRKGTPCQRLPLPETGYCPSHQHLAATEDVALAAA
jgi:hypothetical protein